MRKNFALIVLVIFAVLSAIFYGLEKYRPEFGFDVLMGGNVMMAVLSLFSFYLVAKQLGERPQAFVRGVYSATFLKLIVCMAAILTYALMNREHIHKPTLFILFGIYAVYTAIETGLLSKLARE